MLSTLNLIDETNNAKAAPNKLHELLIQQLSTLEKSVIELERRKSLVHRVDGQIIGTGEADFTKGNTLYTLNYKEKTFQLIDVPGIEGDETKYAHMVREAVAKAHLVFYVNGTNKKPEKATAEKIRFYLRRGTQVCPIINVRGNADAYEFEEDRESLESHGGAGAALKQTVGVLESVLNKDVLLSGHCVQGLLAFTSLAMDSESGKTSIHPSRSRDLVVQQRNYLKPFASTKAMFGFSQMQTVAAVLHTKLGTFREDIIESNKVKVRELLKENIGNLQEAHAKHQKFIVGIEPEFEKCRESINGALQTFERLIATGRKNLWDEFFNKLIEDAYDAIDEHFGDNNGITVEIKNSAKLGQINTETALQKQFEKYINTLQESLQQTTKRLIEDIERIDFQQRIALPGSVHKNVYHTADLDMAVGLKDWGSIAASVGSYALTGAGIGTGFAPGIGTAIGAAVGAAVGILVSVMHLFTSKKKRIRKAQAQVHEKINEVRNEVLGKLSTEIVGLMKSVRQEVAQSRLSLIDNLYASLVRPLSIIHQQIKLMTHLESQLEKMPHGTIQSIQR